MSPSTFFSALTGLLLLLTLLPLSRNRHWIIRGMDFPRLQFASFAALLLLAELIVLDLGEPLAMALLGITALCLIWQISWILPYTPLWPVEVKAAGSADNDRMLSILTANVLTPNRNADALLALVAKHEPDVLVTLESDQWWQDQLDSLSDRMPHSIKCPLDNLYGMHVYSRLPLSEATVDYLVEDHVPSMHALLTLRNGVQVRLHVLHPAPPSPTENPESAERDAELVVVARSVADSDQPIVVTGDLNDVAWSATTRLFRKLSGLLDPRVGRGMYNTFHADYPIARWPLDHLFHSEHFILRSLERMPHIGSDHFALLVRLIHAPQRGEEQQGPEVQQQEQKWADELADAQDVEAGDVHNPR
ncbi:MAG: endonuclease/exonuclease/phosphatase family protein [Pseudomonadales bacterium]|nr:endonuclease/exonuclease/phosphatase family protein [Pseudomonadales bacterium]